MQQEAFDNTEPFVALYLLQHEEDSTACYREGCRGTVPLANPPDAGLHSSDHTQSPDRCSGRRKSLVGLNQGDLILSGQLTHG